MLTKAAILERTASPTVREVDVPEWGGSVYVRVIGGAELDILMNRWHELGGADGKNPAQINANVVLAAACDEQGRALFEYNDLGKLVRMPIAGVKRVADAAIELNGLTETELGRAEENSEPAPTGSSGSSSPGT